jgi:hypothetical protein
VTPSSFFESYIAMKMLANFPPPWLQFHLPNERDFNFTTNIPIRILLASLDISNLACFSSTSSWTCLAACQACLVWPQTLQQLCADLYWRACASSTAGLTYPRRACPLQLSPVPSAAEQKAAEHTHRSRDFPCMYHSIALPRNVQALAIGAVVRWAESSRACTGGGLAPRRRWPPAPAAAEQKVAEREPEGEMQTTIVKVRASVDLRRARSLARRQHTGSGGGPWKPVVSPQRDFYRFFMCWSAWRRRSLRRKRFLLFLPSLFINFFATSANCWVVNVIKRDRNYHKCPIGTALRNYSSHILIRLMLLP